MSRTLSLQEQNFIGVDLPVILITLKVSRKELVPDIIKQSSRKISRCGSGIEIINTEKDKPFDVADGNTGVSALLQDIQTSGYSLLKADWVPYDSGVRTYYFVSFEFNRNELLTDKFSDKPKHKKVLKTMLSSALWDVQVFRTPCFKEGNRRIRGKGRMIIIKLCNRKPLNNESWVLDRESQQIRLQSEPIMVWPRDANGKKKNIFEKIPITPTQNIVIEDSRFKIITI
ncbi:MAG: hypothetical protein CO137_03250 [Candidatus Magasanikbacteria bacterium CG_4_9_14_3_um_filter_32_9]|uniref:Uncharacterized protein n=1 Tax=Candidatus Magasanikbacteria bacterium CG_4_9_14_3_um_filter_32_9 TaxID=1974644 RepID=A0A2M7Z697_9BACT|nr:MAG: hypothetical protein CO137_03250 [Candidatus Magasanikbacteria bacterium CG_4_9_14_3_um_filter_32_9]